MHAVSAKWSGLQQSLRRHPIRTDTAFAVLSAAFALLSNQDIVETAKRSAKGATRATTSAAEASTVALAGQSSTSFGVAAVLICVLSAFPLAIRRLAPFWCLVASIGFPLLGWMVKVPDQSISLLVIWFAVHAIAQYSNGRSLLWGRRLVVLLLLGTIATSAVFTVVDDETNYLNSASRVRLLFLAVFGTGAVFGTAWLSGWLGRDRAAHMTLLAQRAAELEQRQDEQARQAVLDERVRIAREVHDVVAHHVSVMGVQAGAARMMLAKDPAKAGAVIGQIEASSRSAITDLSRLVMFLRDSNTTKVGTVADAPQPELAHLPALFEEAQLAGMDLTVDISGDSSRVPASVGLCAYRIVQEALTNVRKHASVNAATQVDINYGEHGIDVVVQNRGRIGADAPGRGTGHGIIGMRERVALVGGTLTAGPVPGGYRVKAWLPLDGNAASPSSASDQESVPSPSAVSVLGQPVIS